MEVSTGSGSDRVAAYYENRDCLMVTRSLPLSVLTSLSCGCIARLHMLWSHPNSNQTRGYSSQHRKLFEQANKPWCANCLPASEHSAQYSFLHLHLRPLSHARRKLAPPL